MGGTRPRASKGREPTLHCMRRQLANRLTQSLSPAWRDFTRRRPAVHQNALQSLGVTSTSLSPRSRSSAHSPLASINVSLVARAV